VSGDGEGIRTWLQANGWEWPDAAERAEIERLRVLVANYENAITWDTTCTNCARLMDGNYDQYCEIERLRAAGDALAEVALIAVIHCKDHDVEQCNRAYAAWQEARRER
jgi:hypothetical protein